MVDPDLDRLAAECLDRMADEGESGLEAFCREQPHEAERIRGMVRQLRGIGFLEAPPPDLDSIGDYRILSRLGSGGMGVVYLAEHVLRGGRVALKVVRPEFLGDRRARDRFAREVGIIERLDHPGICPIYEAGEFDGNPFLAMQYVDGDTLAEWVAGWRRAETGGTRSRADGARLRIAEAQRIVESVARAVHTAHEAGVVHRDLKPENVVLDGGRRPVVLDFGLARLTDAADVSLTASGEMLGTPAYMAPEQVDGRGRVVGPPADVYALGAILFEAVTLHRPIERESRQALYRAILEEDPEDARGLEPEVSPGLATVLAHALHKDPRRRFGSALELAEELARLRRQEPVRVRPPAWWQRVRRWSAANRAVTAALLLILFALSTATLALLETRVAYRAAADAVHFFRAQQQAARDPSLALGRIAAVLERSDVDAEVQSEALATAQELLFELPRRQVLEPSFDGTPWEIRVSPSRDRFVVTGLGAPPLVYTRAGQVVPCGVDQPAQHVEWSSSGDQLVVADIEGGIHRFQRSDEGLASIGYWEVEPPLTGLSLDREDRLLVAHGMGGSATLFAQEDRVRLAEDSQRSFWDAAILDDGQLLCDGSLWSRDGARRESPLSDVGEQVDAVAVSADGRFALRSPLRLDVYESDGSRTDLALSTPIEDPTRRIAGARFAPDGGDLLVWWTDGEVQLLRPGMGRRSVVVGPRSIFAADFAPERQSILIGTWGGELVELGSDLRERRRIQVFGRGIRSLGWLGDGRVAVVSHAGAVQILELDERVAQSEVDGLEDSRLARSGARLLITGKDGEVAFGERPFDKWRRVVTGAGVGVGGFSPDGGRVCVARADGTLWTGAWSGPLQQVDGELPSGFPADIAWMLDGTILVRMAGNILVRWNGQDRPKVSRPVGDRSVSAVVTDGRRSWIGTWEGAVHALDREGRAVDPPLCRADGPVVELAISASGETLLGCSSHGQALLWRATDGRQLGRLRGHDHAVQSACFDESGQLVATASMDGTVRIWSVAAVLEQGGDGTAVFAADHPGVRQVMFVAEDRFVTVDKDQGLRWWWLRPGPVVEAIRAAGIPVGGRESRAGR